MRTLTIGKDSKIPALGLGTWKSNKGEVGQAVASAIDLGYRHIDCAPIYQNEREVGLAIDQAVKDHKVRRHELWVTSKLWNNAHGAQYVRPALERTLKDLRVDYLDLFLIHWPVHFQANVTFPRKTEEFIPFTDIPLAETWQAMEKMVKKGLCRHIGVCNFNRRWLGELLDNASIPPAMNQIELHPYLQQEQMLQYCAAHNILVTAYSPLGSGDRPAGMKKQNEPSLLANPLILELAAKNQITPAQVLLAWGLQRGTIVIPKSISAVRQKENFAAADISLSQEDMTAIGKLERNFRYVDGSFFTGSGSPYTFNHLWDE
jgi:alcohol dehydrogenase (NADP+)